MSQMSGQQTERAFVAVSTNTTIGLTHHNAILLVTASTGIVTITVPAASTMPNGFQVTIVRAAASTYDVQVSGGYSQTLTASDAQRSIACDGSALWSMIGGGGSGGGGTPDAHAASHAIGAADTVFPTGTALQVLRRNTGNTALEFADAASGSSGGGWGKSSQVTLTATQSNLAVNDAVNFASISGDHTLSGNRIVIKGGEVAVLEGSLYVQGNTAPASVVVFQWWDYTNSKWVGTSQTIFSVNWPTDTRYGTPTVLARVTKPTDTEYQLRVKAVTNQVDVRYDSGCAMVYSTLPNASVTSQVIRKETLSAATTAWTVTLPVSCKAIRCTLVLNNGTASLNTIILGVNGNSTGHRQYTFSSNGSTLAAGEGANTGIGEIRASGVLDRDFTLKISDGETRYNAVGGDYAASSSLTSFTQYMRIAQSADISSLTFTGDQTNGIGAGSYIIVERVDADLSQDLGWQDYTPTCYINLTSATTVPNITPSVRYSVQGKTLVMQGTLNFTGAPTGATDLAISLPTGVNVVSLPAASKFPYAGHSAFTGGSGTWMGTVRLPGSTENSGRVAFRVQTSASVIAAISTTVPFTWANTHQLEFDFFTEIQ